MRLFITTFAAFCFACSALAQTSGVFVTAGTNGAVARPTNFFDANAAAIKAAISLDADFVRSNTVPGISAASPGVSRYYGTDAGGTKGYFPLPAGGGGDGDMQESVYDVDGNGIVDEADLVDWASVTNKPVTFPPSSHAHAAADVTSGVMSPARLGSGSPGAGNYLRGDGVWDAVGVADLSDMSALGELIATASDAAAARLLLGIATGTTSGTFASGDDSRFLTTGEKADLTDAGDSTLHYHAADRARANHTGTQARSTISDFAHASTHLSGGGDALAGNLDAVARTTVRKNSGSDVGSRRRLNLTEGAGVSITVADDPGNEEIDVVINASAEGSTNTALLSQANTFTATNTFEAAINAPGGINAGTLTATQLNVGTLNVSGTIDGSKVGTGIAAGNITSGTVDNARLDSDLAAIGNNSTSGLLSRTGAGTAAARTLSGTSGRVIVSNGDGVSGNPTVDIDTASLDDSINGGVPNGSGAFLHWSKLVGVPAGFADGSDDGSGAADLSGSGTSSNNTAFALLTLPVELGNSTVADLLVSGSGPTNSFTARLIASAFNRNPGSPSIRTNSPTLRDATGSSDAWLSLSGTSLVLNARGPDNENFAWSYKGSTLTQSHGATNAGSGLVALSKTSMIFAWDFDSASDSHSGGHNLSESNSPTYSGGLGHTSLATTSFWETATANLLYNTNSASSFTLAGRVRVNAGASNGRYIFASHQYRDTLRYNSPSNSARVAQNLTTTLLNAPATNEWLNFVMTYNGTTNRSIWLNGIEYTASEAYAQNVGSLKIGTDSATGAYNIPISFDRFYGWGRVLTTNEIAVLNAATNDNAITYGMLSP